MDERSTGLILRLRPLTESSLIVHWLTRDLGRVATVAKGARRPNSPFRGKLDLFFLADLSLRRSRSSNLHTLLEVCLREVHPALRKDWGHLQQAAYAASLLEVATETDTPIPELFELLAGFVAHLSSTAPGAAALLGFEAKTLQQLGLDPCHNPGPISAATRHTLQTLGELDWAALGALSLPQSQARELSGFLHLALADTLRVPKSRAAVLRAVIGQPQ